MNRSRVVAAILALVAATTGCSSSRAASQDCSRGPVTLGSASRPGCSLKLPAPALTAQPSRHDAAGDALPAAVLRACGHPGSRVVLSVVELVVPRSVCDLTGVTLVYDKIGVTVPAERGGGAVAHADGPAGSSTTEASVNKATGDVTFVVTHS